MTAFQRDLRRARDRLRQGDPGTFQMAASGRIEYGQRGQGPAVLIAHPLYGGFDAGLGLARTYLGDGYRIIAPSRFGYLGSNLPKGATPATQADAYASLLDHLEVSQVVVFGYSAGGPSAIEFALRHRDRTTALVLMGSALPGKAGAPPKWVARTLLGSDAFFWLMRRLLPTQLGRLMGVPAGLRLTAEQRIAVADAEESLFPVAPRKEGMLFDLYVSNPAVQDATLELITAPTTIINARDDPLSAFDNAARAADRIPGCRLVVVPTGGHLLLGSESVVRDEVRALTSPPAL
jgi:pimeloyl-ACP methyl ester carboxylesterase